jgi:hypothetical protein
LVHQVVQGQAQAVPLGRVRAQDAPAGDFHFAHKEAELKKTRSVCHLDLDADKIAGARYALLPGDPFRSEAIAERYGGKAEQIADTRSGTTTQRMLRISHMALSLGPKAFFVGVAPIRTAVRFFEPWCRCGEILFRELGGK